MLFKVIVLKNFAIFTGKHLCKRHFLIKLQTRKPARNTPTQVFSFEYCEILLFLHEMEEFSFSR